VLNRSSSFLSIGGTVDEFDLAVVGAGTVGVHTAWLAAVAQPRWRILLADRGLVGCGATQYSAGLIFPFGPTSFHRILAAESAHSLRELRVGIPALRTNRFRLFVIADQSHLDEAYAGFAPGLRRSSKRDLAFLQDRVPGIRVPAGKVVLCGHEAECANPQDVARVVACAFRRLGDRCQCWEGSSIEAVSPLIGEGFELRTSDGRNIVAKRAVVATGPWVLSTPVGDYSRDLGIRLKKVAALHIESCPSETDPVVLFFDEDAFLLPLVSRRQWLFSFTCEEWDVVAEAPRLLMTEGDLKLALSILRQYHPDFAGRCSGGRVFCDAYGPNRAPVIAKLADDLILAGAGSGSGFRLSLGIASSALRLLSGMPKRVLRSKYPRRPGDKQNGC
jgi:glycine/D-amino acid oxidase-like deaminating enzyme